MDRYKDYNESPTMQEIHRIQEEMEQQYEKSGLSSYEEWLQATEKDLRQSLAEIGYRMVIRGDRFYLYEIKPSLKKNDNNFGTLPKGGERHSVVSPSSKTKMIKHKNYDEYFEDSTVQEIHQIREEIVKYKTASKRNKMSARKK